MLTDFIVLKDLKRLTLVGSSLGAAIILVALLRNRDELAPRVRALCLIDAIAYPQDFPFIVEILRTPILAPIALRSLPDSKENSRRGFDQNGASAQR